MGRSLHHLILLDSPGRRTRRVLGVFGTVSIILLSPHPVRPQVPDPAEVSTVHNVAARYPSGSVRVGSSPLLQIGSVEGSRGTDLTAVLSVVVLPGGDIAVTDLAIPEIRIFNGQTGQLRRVIGREGGGPGEFRAAPVIVANARGDVLAWDPGSARLSRFSVAGELLHEEPFTGRFRGLSAVLTLKAWQVRQDRSVLSTAGRVTWRRGAFETVHEVMLMSPSSGRSTTIGDREIQTHVTDRTYFLADPFNPRRAVGSTDSRIFISHAGGWRLLAYDESGRLRRVITAAIPRTPITPALRMAERRGLLRHQPDAVFARLYDRLPSRDSTAAISVIHPAPDNQLWVGRWRSRTSEGAQVFDAIDEDGIWLHTIRLPPLSGELLAVGRNRIITGWRDPMGIPYLRVYALLSDNQ
jgi:hypothetical protein